MIRETLLGLAISLTLPAHLPHDQWAQLTPDQRHWFDSQTVPSGQYQGFSCCSIADAQWAEEDIIQGRYWTRWRINGALTAWMPVPPDAVLPVPNRNPNGSAVVWYGYQDGQLFIRCFAPGSKV